MPNFEVHGWLVDIDIGPCLEAGEIEELIGNLVQRHAPHLVDDFVVNHICSWCKDRRKKRQPFVRIFNSDKKHWPVLDKIAAELRRTIDVEMAPTLRRFVPKES